MAEFMLWLIWHSNFTVYIRQNSPWKSQLKSKLRPKPTIDIQTLMATIGQRSEVMRKRDNILLNLRGVDVRGADLRSGHFESVDFQEAHLEGVLFGDAHLYGAQFGDAHLSDADFTFIHVQGANFCIFDRSTPGMQDLLRVSDVQDWADLMGSARLENVDLRLLDGLDQSQVDCAYGNEMTNLPTPFSGHRTWKKLDYSLTP